MQDMLNDQEHLKKLSKELDLIKSDVKAIKDALVGNEFNENMGFTKRIAIVEQDVKEIKENYLKNKWLIIGLAAGSGVGGAALIKEIITAFFH